MSSMSDYTENAVIQHILRGSAMAQPSTIYVALFTADPTDANTTANEVQTSAWPAYARLDAAAGAGISTGWAAPSNGVTSNAKALTYAANNGSGTVTVTHVGLYDALTGGNLLFHAPMPQSKALAVADVLAFAIGAITLTLQ